MFHVIYAFNFPFRVRLFSSSKERQFSEHCHEY